MGELERLSLSWRAADLVRSSELEISIRIYAPSPHPQALLIAILEDQKSRANQKRSERGIEREEEEDHSQLVSVFLRHLSIQQLGSHV